MTRLILCSFFVLLNFMTFAQKNSLAWFTNLEEATTAATENGQDILMVFAGSDWCKPCIQFKKDILQSTDFTNAVQEKLVVLYLDFPSRKKNKLPAAETAHNEALAERFNKSGAFPKIVLMDAQENVLATPEFRGQNASDFLEKLQPTFSKKTTLQKKN